jgi:uncharacterized membrane protein (UPF0182 family)
VSARIDQDAVISPQLSLWNQRGSQTILGNMLVLPIHDSIVYIQPLYLQAEKAAIPQLTRVIVVYADKIEMESTLEGALMKVFGEEGSAAADGAVQRDTSDSEDTTATPSSTSTSGDAALAAKLYSEATAAQRAGDWATYGSKIKELGTVLERMSAESDSKN